MSPTRVSPSTSLSFTAITFLTSGNPATFPECNSLEECTFQRLCTALFTGFIEAIMTV